MEEKKNLKYLKEIASPWKTEKITKECAKCATSCQSACKTSCTVGNIPCEKRR